MTYCVYDLCGTNEHCCGNNQCCSDVYPRSYIIIGLNLLIAIIIYWIWYYVRRRRRNNIKVCDANDEEPLINSKDIRSVD